MNRLLCEQMDSLIVPGEHWLPTLANVSAAIMHGMPQLNWVGFYLKHRNADDRSELLLGPFQGNTACVSIPFGRGVCGTAALRNETVVVPDVHEFPGHIACDSASASEIVVPIHDKAGTVCGVLDIDSPVKSRFSHEDREMLEYCVRLIEERTELHALD